MSSAADNTLPSWLRHTGNETHLLREVLRTQQALLGAFSREVGIPGARLALLRRLAHADPGGAGVMDLARQLRINAAAVTRQMAALEEAGLVTRKADAQDKRRIAARLTPRGRQLFQKIHARAHAFEAALTTEVSPADIVTTIRVLRAVQDAIQAPGEESR